MTGELPSPAVARLIDAILVSSIDHGATPPSALAARTVASTGATLSASVAAGIMSINRHHGGAIEDCARQLKAIADLAAHESISMEAARRTLAAMRETGERMPGFGQRVATISGGSAYWSRADGRFIAFGPPNGGETTLPNWMRSFMRRSMPVADASFCTLGLSLRRRIHRPLLFVQIAAKPEFASGLPA